MYICICFCDTMVVQVALVCRLDVDAESKLQEETRNINVSLHNFSKVGYSMSLVYMGCIMFVL